MDIKWLIIATQDIIIINSGCECSGKCESGVLHEQPEPLVKLPGARDGQNSKTMNQPDSEGGNSKTIVL